MLSPDVRCALVKIHGIGTQPETWSRDFDTLLSARLATLAPDQQAQIVQESVWWADLSRLPGQGLARAAAPAGTGSATYDLAYQQYTTYLAANQVAISRSAEAFTLPFGDFAGQVIARLRDGLVTVGDQAKDVANYVRNNGVRLAIQKRLSDSLFKVHAEHPQATIILGSHSQGAIIAYDVLRLIGPQLGPVVWVTMGSPLAWYLNVGHWGAERLGIRETTTWLNYYDPRDIIGNVLAGLVRWPRPQPEDIDVDNVAQGLDAHDHWRNPEVVERYFQLIKRHLT